MVYPAGAMAWPFHIYIGLQLSLSLAVMISSRCCAMHFLWLLCSSSYVAIILCILQALSVFMQLYCGFCTMGLHLYSTLESVELNKGTLLMPACPHNM